ncbi:HAMP domain-containing protein [Desulfacinum hydrothermale DSM 13146]|uniref:HAMP domain-containing protein n=1 Tax=Desulfacinum hydrothermale DSM 13146 TaxID=1121390 RepID=A0A1W1XAE2_9BACT|nr:methyl-accepting chemotaxis protein [Desulfacinum hydrothermale]SMC20810.1 HAMP domain-containing protein [Desulfacinum hydrothermale DSM 13146]
MILGRLRKSLTWRLAVSFGGLVTAALVLSGAVNWMFTKQDVREDAFRGLSVVSDFHAELLESYLRGRLQSLRMLAESQEVQDILGWAAGRAGLNRAGGEQNTRSSYGVLGTKAHERLLSKASQLDLADLFLLAPEDPVPVYSVRSGLQSVPELNEKTAKAMASLRTQVLQDHRVAWGKPMPYGPDGSLCLPLALPIKAVAGDRPAGVVLAVLGTHTLDRILDRETQLAATVHSALVDAKGRFAGIGEKEVSRGLNPQLVSEALADGSRVRERTEAAGGSVLRMATPLGLSKTLGFPFDWILITQMNEAEALAPMRALAFRFGGFGILLALGACVVGVFLSRSLVGPLRSLETAVREVGRGNLNVSIDASTRQDEVGGLINSFHAMVQSLRDQTREILEGVNALAASMSEISATAAQLAASSTETATAVSEISSTAEEVRQTAQVAQQKADGVSQDASRMTQTSEEGRFVTREAIQGLQRIQKEMDFVAENVMRLSEQGQNIEDIIGTVRDLADQINLLSVNAAIEAAKAGEHGKGFAVVAHEMRSLADQSKEATEQIKQILSEVQKITSSAVLAMERGAKAVKAGLEQGEKAGEAVERLAATVEASADSALQIAASSHEQLVGVEQLVQAIQNIDEATGQNTEGARQLEMSVRDLERLSQSLKNAAARFQV